MRSKLAFIINEYAFFKSHRYHLINLLTHTKISSEIILNLTHEETKQFKDSAKKGNNWQNVLVKLNKHTLFTFFLFNNIKIF